MAEQRYVLVECLWLPVRYVGCQVMADCRYVLAECLLQAVRAVQRKAEWARVACRSAISGRSRTIMNSQTLRPEALSS